MNSSDRAVQSVRESLAEAPEDDPVAWELECLWDDLDDARRKSHNGVWSIGCDHVLHRIVVLTRHYGHATKWDAVPYTFLLDGTYTRVHEAMGIAPQPFDADEVRRTWEEYLGRSLP